MKKILEYKIIGANELHIIIQITAQSHLRENFGSNGLRYFTATNGIIISSDEFPVYYSDYEGLFCKGNNSNFDNTYVTIPLSQWPRVCVAIREYNDFEFSEELKEYSVRLNKSDNSRITFKRSGKLHPDDKEIYIENCPWIPKGLTEFEIENLIKAYNHFKNKV